MNGLSARDQRALTLGVILTLGAFVLARGVPLWWRLTDDAVTEARIAQRALADARSLIAAEGTLRDSLAARRARLVSVDPGLLSAARPKEAASRLGRIVTEMASASGLAVSMMIVQADTIMVDDFGRPIARVEAKGDIRGLAAFLSSLDRGAPRLVIRELTITQPDPVGVGRPEELRLSFVIGGLVRPVAPVTEEGSEQ